MSLNPIYKGYTRKKNLWSEKKKTKGKLKKNEAHDLIIIIVVFIINHINIPFFYYSCNLF